MGMGRVRLHVVAVALVVAACGDPDSVRAPVADTGGSTSSLAVIDTSVGVVPTTLAVPRTSDAPTVPPTTTPVPAGGPLAFCDGDPPPLDRRGPQVSAEDERLIRQWSVFADLVNAHGGVLTGAWWDAAAGEFVVLVADAAAARPLVEGAAPAGVRYRIEAVTRSYGDLVALSRSLVQAAHAANLAHSGDARLDGRVGVDLAVRDRASVEAIAALAGDDADVVCVRGGADPATVVPIGPQPMTGDGWRLLAEPAPGRAAAPISVASSDGAYAALWSALGLGGAPPTVDVGSEVVVAVVNGEAPGCEHQLTGVTFDREARRVRVELVVPGGERPCVAMATSRVYVVAVLRSRLPALPFLIVNRGDQCAGTCPGDPLEVTTL